MAPKSKRGKEREDFDSTRFVSANAQIRYNEFASNRKFILERAFHHPGGMIENVIAARQWEQFCYFSAVAVISVVREFYANFPASLDNEVYVRGTSVEFTPEVINTFFGLPPVTDCFFAIYSPSEGELDEILHYLTDGRGSWKIRNGKRVNFSSSKLNATSKAWHYFISACLLPSNHLSEVTKERAILSYCIQEMRPIDVGTIIFDVISTSARSSVISGLGFPATIFSICKVAGISYSESEEKLKPQKPIGKTHIDIYGKSKSQSSSQPTYSAPSSSVPPSAGPSSSTSEDRWNTVCERYLEHQSEMFMMHCRLEDMDSKIDHLSEYMQRKSDYDSDHNAALVRFLKGDHSVEFPTSPRFTPWINPREPVPDPTSSEDETADD